jgi:hypothetical protein
MDDVVKEYVDRSIDNQNVTNCPLEAPFYNDTDCIACNETAPYFNI